MLTDLQRPQRQAEVLNRRGRVRCHSFDFDDFFCNKFCRKFLHANKFFFPLMRGCSSSFPGTCDTHSYPSLHDREAKRGLRTALSVSDLWGSAWVASLGGEREERSAGGVVNQYVCTGDLRFYG